MRVFQEREVREKTTINEEAYQKIKNEIDEKGYIFLDNVKDTGIIEELKSSYGMDSIKYQINGKDYYFIADNRIIEWLVYYEGDESIKNVEAAVWLYNSVKKEVLERINNGNEGNNPHYHASMYDALEKYITALVNFILYKNPHKKEINTELFEKIGLFKEENWLEFNRISKLAYGEVVDKATLDKINEHIKYVGYSLEKSEISVTYICKEDVGSHVKIVKKTEKKIIKKAVEREIEKRVVKINNENELENLFSSLKTLCDKLEYKNIDSPSKEIDKDIYRKIVKANMPSALALYLNLYHNDVKLPVLPPESYD